MNDPLRVDLFVEDEGHERLVRALLARVSAEEEREIEIGVRTARGGHGRVIEELTLYQRAAESGTASLTIPDMLVAAVDTNCMGFAAAQKTLREALRPAFADRAVLACPDPHVERWYLADPASFHVAVGYRPTPGRRKCQRGHYKDLLARAVVAAGHPPTLGGIEFADEIIAAMDLYRAGRSERSLGNFIAATRAFLRLH